jgi:hypothetical protein
VEDGAGEAADQAGDSHIDVDGLFWRSA